MKYETVIVIPNFNGMEHLRECLNSFRDQTYDGFKIVLVDNNSIDESVDFVKKNYPEVDIIVLEKNEGYAVPINVGSQYSIKEYSPKYIGWFNNDTLLDKNCLLNLVKAFDSIGQIAAVTANEYYYDYPKLIHCQGGSQNRVGESYPLNRKKSFNDAIHYNEVLFPSGAGCLINVNSFLEIGFLDERYFTYHEDTDWGWRANLYGYKIHFEKKALLYHKVNSTSRKFPLQTLYYVRRNPIMNLVKNYELMTLMRTFPFLVFNYYLFIFRTLFVHKDTFREKLSQVRVVFSSILWNVINLKETLKRRQIVQKKRKLKDKDLFYLMDRK